MHCNPDVGQDYTRCVCKAKERMCFYPLRPGSACVSVTMSSWLLKDVHVTAQLGQNIDVIHYIDR